MTGPIIRPGSTAVNVVTGATEQEWPGIADEFPASATPTAAVPVTLAPGSLSVFSGTPTSAVVANWPVFVLPDGSTNGVAGAPALQPGVEYDVFLRWSVSATSAGNVQIGYGVETYAEGAVPSGATSRFLTLATTTANLIRRTQIAEVAYIAPDGTGPSVRVDRRGADALDTYTGSVQILSIEFVPRETVTDATITNGGALAVSVYPTPYDGLALQRGVSLYTPIWSTASYVYVTEPVTIGGTQQSRVAKLDKTTYATVQDVQLATATHETSVGHRNPSVAVTAAGAVVTHPEAHHLAWAGKHSTSSEDLTTLTATTTPTGTDTNCSYRRFFRNPYNGDLWLAMRANTYYGGLYKWNAGASTWTQITGGYFTNQGTYGGALAWASATTMYAATEWLQSTTGGVYSGYPRRAMGVIKSTDGGTTWTTITGQPLLIPLAPGTEARIAFPAQKDAHTSVASRLAVAADGTPVLVAAWQHPSESYRSLWSAKWDAANGNWTRRRILQNNGTNSVGIPHLIYTQAGRIIVSISTVDDHTGSSESTPPNNAIHLFVSGDGLAWTRYTCGIGQAFGGAYLDPEAYRLDGKLRMLPFDEVNVTRSEVWETTLPA